MNYYLIIFRFIFMPCKNNSAGNIQSAAVSPSHVDIVNGEN
jgi:hypothetical protein